MLSCPCSSGNKRFWSGLSVALCVKWTNDKGTALALTPNQCQSELQWEAAMTTNHHVVMYCCCRFCRTLKNPQEVKGKKVNRNTRNNWSNAECEKKMKQTAAAVWFIRSPHLFEQVDNSAAQCDQVSTQIWLDVRVKVTTSWICTFTVFTGVWILCLYLCIAYVTFRYTYSTCAGYGSVTSM